jgi:hypothetical protein
MLASFSEAFFPARHAAHLRARAVTTRPGDVSLRAMLNSLLILLRVLHHFRCHSDCRIAVQNNLRNFIMNKLLSALIVSFFSITAFAGAPSGAAAMPATAATPATPATPAMPAAKTETKAEAKAAAKADKKAARAAKAGPATMGEDKGSAVTTDRKSTKAANPTAKSLKTSATIDKKEDSKR